MDNREAIKAIIERLIEKYSRYDCEYGFKYIDADNDDIDDFSLELWQAATAHNTDAVIDECVNDVTQILQLISIYYAEKLPTYDARAGLSVICSNYPESLRNKLRSLKTNKEG